MLSGDEQGGSSLGGNWGYVLGFVYQLVRLVMVLHSFWGLFFCKCILFVVPLLVGCLLFWRSLYWLESVMLAR